MSKQSARQICFPWMESAEASPARTCPVQEGARGSTAPDLGSGLNTGDSLKNSALDGALSKTSRRASAHGCPVCSMISCPLATGRRLSALELWTLARRTGGCEPSSSLWRTHLVRDGNAARLSNQIWSSTMAGDSKGRAGLGRESAQRQLSNQVISWATPTRNGNTNRKGLSPTSGDGLRTQVGDMLSARWVEMLMGFPEDWTATDGPPDVGKNKKRGSRRGSQGAAKSRKTRPG